MKQKGKERKEKMSNEMGFAIILCIVLAGWNKTFFRVVAMIILIGIAIDANKVKDLLTKKCHPAETTKSEAGQNAQSNK